MYIDAGSGSMILQAVAAGFFTFLVFFRQIWGWGKMRFAKHVATERRPHDEHR